MTEITDEIVEGKRNIFELNTAVDQWPPVGLEEAGPGQTIRMRDPDTGELVVDPDNETSTTWLVTDGPTKAGGIWSLPVEPIV